MEINIRVGGEAGQGLQFIGSSLARIISRKGFHLFTHQDYMSRIRGGHNFYQLRISDESIPACSCDTLDILLALDADTIAIHKAALSENGIVIYDPEMVGREIDEDSCFAVPFLQITEQLNVSKIMANSAAVGAVLGGLGIDVDLLPDILRSLVGKKGEEVIASNMKVAEAGWDYVRRNERWPQGLRFSSQEHQGLMLINGNQAVGFGALASGCKFYAAYPMTPSTGIMNYLAGKAKDHHLVVEQAEDEIAAINMALGASFAGVRAMTGTSGGGFALMAEGLSLAGITELPIVIAEVQRPGPATGLPTRTEQGDLLFVLYCGHGEFPRVLFAPGTPEQAIRLTSKAFDLAEKYQVPAIVQSDQYLADSEWTYNEIDTSRLKYTNYRMNPTGQADPSSYKRFSFTDSGVSPLAVPGLSQSLIVVDSDEHDEEGHIIEDAETRIRMVEKRWHKKMPALRKEISPPLFYGHPEPKIIVVGYGSTYGVMHEAVTRLENDHEIAFLHFSEIWPFPDTDTLDFVSLLNRSSLAICVENNASGQFAKLFRGETGFLFKAFIRKYDGRPFLLEPFMREINEHIRRI